MIEEIIDDTAAKQALELVEFFAADVPKKQTNACMKFISQYFPHSEEFRHLRRVRKRKPSAAAATAASASGEAGGLEVLLCSAAEADRGEQTVERMLAHEALPCALVPKVVLVPRHPAPSKAVLDEVNRLGHWPQKLVLKKKPGPPPLDDADKQRFVRWMVQLALSTVNDRHLAVNVVVGGCLLYTSPSPRDQG